MSTPRTPCTSSFSTMLADDVRWGSEKYSAIFSMSQPDLVIGDQPTSVLLLCQTFYIK